MVVLPVFCARFRIRIKRRTEFIEHANDLKVDEIFRNLGYLFLIEFFVDSYIVRKALPGLIAYL